MFMFTHVHAAITLLWLTLVAVWLVTAMRLKPSQHSMPWRGRSWQMLALGCAAVLLFSDMPRLSLLEARYLPPEAALVATGIALTAIGIAFAIGARLYLGRNWSAAPAIRQDHELVSRGPYRLVRHPIYTGMLVASIGTAIAFAQVRDLIAVPILLLAFWLKARFEERLLLSEFGESYITYRRTVRGAIIPYLL